MLRKSRSVAYDPREEGTSFRKQGNGKCRTSLNFQVLQFTSYCYRCLREVFNNGAWPLFWAAIMFQRRVPHPQNDKGEPGYKDDICNKKVSFHPHTKCRPIRDRLEFATIWTGFF